MITMRLGTTTHNLPPIYHRSRRPSHPPSSPRLPRRRPQVIRVEATFGVDSFFPALNVAPEIAVLASAGLATSSVVINYFSGVQLEKQRGEMALELERDKLFQQQLRELQGVIARYRGPLLEAAIDLEQRLWHLVTDQCFDSWNTTDGRLEEESRYLMFTLSQFLGFVEVVRREGPRERPFLQAGNPQGSDTLSTLLEGVRFCLCASTTTLEHWYMEGPERMHPGARLRRDRVQVVERLQQTEVCPDQSALFLDPPLLRVSRGQQRAIGTLMITTPMGAERHYTMSYGDFHSKLDEDPSFARWFIDIKANVRELAAGFAWKGESPFPCGRWSRVLLLQQLLVELMDVLDPDCVRLSLDRRQRLMPIRWGQLPGVSEYQKGLKKLSQAADFGMHQSALAGLRDLQRSYVKITDPEPPTSPLFRVSRSIDEDFSAGGVEGNGNGARKAPPFIVQAYGENSDSEN